MKKSTLLAISTGISVIVIVISQWVIDYYDYTGRASFIASSPIVSGAVLTPVILLALTPFNQRLLSWRKARGRDIEEEERYESPGGMISLTRRDDDH